MRVSVFLTGLARKDMSSPIIDSCSLKFGEVIRLTKIASKFSTFLCTRTGSNTNVMNSDYLLLTEILEGPLSQSPTAVVRLIFQLCYPTPIHTKPIVFTDKT